jgi:hypothetical protein
VTAAGAVTAPADGPARSPGGHRVRPVTVVLAVVVIGLAAMWVYALAFNHETSPNRMRDQAWARSAQAVCGPFATQVGALPKAPTFASITPRSEALRRRAEVGAHVTRLLSSMVAALRALPPPTDAASARGAARWLADYDTYLGDRRRQLVAWQAARDPSFAETAVNGAPISLGMDAFADANAMTACTVPQDLG